MTTRIKINLIGCDNGAGISREIAIIRDVLGNRDFCIHFTPTPEKDNQTVWARLRLGLREYSITLKHYLRRNQPTGGEEHDLNLFLDRPEPALFARARLNCLIPHQEWFQPVWKPFLSCMDSVLCLTRDAERIFAPLCARADLLGFTSLDRCQAGIERDYNRFIHVGGKSPQKGTALVEQTWRRHPEWPPLTIIRSAGPAAAGASNLEVITRHISDGELRALQNRAGIHLCPSQAEAFGHTLVEGMSCRAVVVATNAAPMNELVTAERGLLAEPHKSWPFGLSTRHDVSVEELERRVNEVLLMPLERRRDLGERARAWFESNDRAFRNRLPALVRELVGTGRR